MFQLGNKNSDQDYTCGGTATFRPLRVPYQPIAVIKTVIEHFK